MVQLSWRSALSDDEAAEVRDLVAAATDTDGQPPLSEAARLRLRHGGEPAAHLLATASTDGADRELAGYAQVADGTAELAVHPAQRRRGIGGELVRALVERAAASSTPLVLWAHGEHPAAVRLARRHGLTEARVLWRMRRSLLDPPDAAELPGGVELRTFVVGQDEAAVVEVNNKAFAWHPEQGGWDVGQVRQREAEPWFDPDGFLLAVDSATGRLLGYHWTKQHSADLGEVYVLGVDPAEHGRGLGKALTVAGLHHLRRRGMSTVMLYVESDNTAAIRTYQRLGFTHWDSDVAYAAG